MDTHNLSRVAIQESVAKLLSKGTIVTLLGMEGLGSEQFIETLLEKKANKYGIVTIFVDCSELAERDSVYFFRTLLYSILEYMVNNGVSDESVEKVRHSLSEKDLFMLIISIQEALRTVLSNSNESTIVIHIFGMTKLTELDSSFFTALRSFNNLDKFKLTFLFRDTYRFLNMFTVENAGELYELVRSNVVWIPMPEGKTFDLLVDGNCSQFEYSLLSQDKDKLYEYTNGHSAFTKYSILYLSNGGKLEISQIINNDAIIVRIERIINDLSDSEKLILQAIASGQKHRVTSLNNRHLINSGLLTEIDGFLTITIPLVEEYLKSKNTRPRVDPGKNIQSISESNKVIIKNDTVFVGGNPLSSELTDKEFSVMKLLYDKYDHIVARDDVASAIWGEFSTEKYSDWAIDQTISRLRKKLSDNGYNPQMVKTIKGRGFKLAGL